MIDVLRECRGLGVRLTAGAKTLQFEAPHGALTPRLKDRLRSHKHELLYLLSNPHELAPFEADIAALIAVPAPAYSVEAQRGKPYRLGPATGAHRKCVACGVEISCDGLLPDGWQVRWNGRTEALDLTCSPSCSGGQP